MTSMRGGCGWARLMLVVGVVAVLAFAGDADGQTCRNLGPQTGMAATLVDTGGDPAIAAVVDAGMMAPCDVALFCPTRLVTRGELAVTAEMALHRTAPEWLPSGSGNVFGDVPSGHPLACWIEAAGGARYAFGGLMM